MNEEQLDQLILLLIKAAGGSNYAKLQAEKIMDILLSDPATRTLHFMELLQKECGRQVMARSMEDFLIKRAESELAEAKAKATGEKK